MSQALQLCQVGKGDGGTAELALQVQVTILVS
jgi:hypothetical protein